MNKRTQENLIRGTLIGELPANLMTGTYLVMFAVHVLNFSNIEISWFLSLVPLAVIIRYPLLRFIQGTPRIYLIRATRVIQVFCLCVFLFLPTQTLSIYVIFATSFVFVLSNDVLSNSVWTNYVEEVTTRADRGIFLGRLRTGKHLAAMIFALIGLMIVGERMDRLEHQFLIGIVLLLLANALFWFFRIEPMTVSVVGQGKGKPESFWKILLTSKLLRRPLYLEMLTKVISWPILPVYLIGVIHVPANVMMGYILAGVFGPVLSTYLWGKTADSSGFDRTYKVYFLCSIFPLALLLLVPDYQKISQGSVAWYIGAVVLSLIGLMMGALGSGAAIATTLYKSHFVNQEMGFLAINIFSLITKLAQSALLAVTGNILYFYSSSKSSKTWAYLDNLIWVDGFKIFIIFITIFLSLMGIRECTKISQQEPELFK